MEQHAGSIVEKIVRRSGLSITELARRINVNRRSVYNWFEQKTLKVDILNRIGRVINHDFANEFPDYYGRIGDSSTTYKNSSESSEEKSTQSSESVYFWMNKYIKLLEQYNQLLLKRTAASLSENTAEVGTDSFSNSNFEEKVY